MPIKACFREGRLATLEAVMFTNPEMNEAKRKAEEQMRAIHAQGYKEK